MFNRKKAESPKKRRPNAGGGLSQFGLMDVDIGIDPTGGADDDDDGDDGDLEAELLALTAGNAPVRPKRVAPPPKPVVNLDSMIAASMRDIPSDEELSDGSDDPDLLSELADLSSDPHADLEETPEQPDVPAPPKPSSTPITTLLSERLKMYQEAETNAKSSGETTRARRFNRGIKTLTDLLKQASLGRPINEEDIPPAVATTGGIGTKAPPPTEEPDPVESPAPPAAVQVDGATLAVLTERRDQYKAAALSAKKAGDTETALKYVKTARLFEPVIAAVEAGQPVDLKKMPPPPPTGEGRVEAVTAEVPQPQVEESQQQTATEEPQEPEESSVPVPTTVREALDQRLALYRSVEAAAKEENNASKARRIGRIVKQYEDALKAHKAGRKIDVEELPTPPGYAPIPQEGGPPAPPPPAAAPPAAPTRAAPPAPPPRAQAAPVTPPPAQPDKQNVRKSPQSRQEKQLAMLLARQQEFKEAALEAKRKGEISQAKEYLRLAKGFGPVILASESGLPVDMDTLPLPPGVNVSFDADFDMINEEDCVAGNDAEIFEKLEGDLLKQAKMCVTTRDHFKAVGDVASANRFEQLALHAKKDLDTLRFAHRRSEPVPKFHYETKTFSIVQCCTDLGDNDLELTIMQGINYNVPNPKDVDTYVRFEFPFPSEDPPKDRTPLVKDTNNPVYNAAFPLQIQRSVRACQRVFKRHSIKLEVWSRGSVLQRLRGLCCLALVEDASSKKEKSGFLRSDTLIGTAMVKLLPLETVCIIHDSFDLLDGRRPVGGKLEVKVRLRNPMMTKQVEQVSEKWLIIDSL